MISEQQLNEMAIMLAHHLKGNVSISYYNGVIFARLENNFLSSAVTITLEVPPEHIVIEKVRQKINNLLYHKMRYFIEKNIFTWYD